METISGFIREYYGYIYCFLAGFWIGIVVIGMICSNFRMKVVDKIDRFIERKIKERKEKKAQKRFEKNIEDYLEVQRRMRW